VSERQVGVLFAPQRPPEALPAAARAAEERGFDELWVVEDCFESGGLAAAGAALAATRSLRVGVGLLPVAVRNPAIAAMEIGTLARLYPRRLSVAFGHGVDAWMRQIDARPERRLAALEETVSAVRALLAGETVTASGAQVKLDGVRLAHVPERPPAVLVGTTGARGLAIAGRAADGMLLPEGAGPAAVRWAREQARAGRVTVYAWLSLDDDAQRTRGRLAPVLERWRGGGLYPRLVALAAGGAEGAVVGDAAACAAAIERLWEAGAATVVLLPVGEDPDAELARAAVEVLPRLTRRA
jgi:alkanesulfonate monooxygenase SsuD/methylene tetrahydromethanopterin reductase-like flavin-dependent oxidoreductase (luciferase family)